MLTDNVGGRVKGQRTENDEDRVTDSDTRLMRQIMCKEKVKKDIKKTIINRMIRKGRMKEEIAV